MKKFTDSLTSLRGIACIAVILCHEDSLDSKGNQSLVDFGYIAVTLFFVLSAYLLTRNILGEIVPDENEPPKSVLNMTLVRYTIRRIFRVYPAFILTIALNYALYCYHGDSSPGGPMDFNLPFQTLFFKSVGNHLWTIRIELAFYFIVLPLFAIIASAFLTIDYKCFKNSKIKTFPVFILCVTLPSVYGLVLLGFVRNFFDYRATIYTHFPIFWIGCLGGIASHYLKSYKPNLDTKRKTIIWEVITYLMVLRIYFGSYAIANRYLGVTGNPWWLSLSFLAPSIPILFLILEKLDTQCSLGRFLSMPAFVYIGKWSYSTYLLHLFTLKLLAKNMNVSGFDGTVLMLVVCNFLGFVLYSLVENPCFRLSKPVIKMIEARVESFNTMKDEPEQPEQPEQHKQP